MRPRTIAIGVVALVHIVAAALLAAHFDPMAALIFAPTALWYSATFVIEVWS